ncbi:hypothetical protein COL5a_004739 [Colletotrichum fioriniae]|uniref:uncharacterized protein n=1 Tax=Colletotrichum fioriniae TaxID=710243 RepID=UPI0023007B6C|nr:uncharacterized protein COL516b_011524 [Colletotrichum fioriniae]KAJ0296499.1 hypothetical protein COL516b_011524 [Colletotrichum fioriniae]KAJ0328944.1 hypothetical protein COL5a_004739 [Colletotrichum fioriniae]KAJ3940489.1 hypothetical protein N0V96_009493 [Colletotrichum fioriniae]
MKALSQARLVDYSDSEDEPESEIVAAPSATGPPDEEGFAQIVIGLQHEYTKEVRELQARQEATDREMALHVDQVNRRLEKQLNVLTSVVKPLKKTRRENADIDDSRYHPREVLEVEPGALDPRTPEAEQVTDIAANEAVVRRKASRQNLLSPRDPVNPYDDPKYFSPLTVVGKDGVMQPIFKFYPHPATVEEQWAEYKYGLHGQKPVELLEKMYRAKWRNGTYGRSWFTRRKAFWDKVKGLLDQGRTEEEALGILRDLGSGSVPTVVAILCKERGGGTRPGRRKSRGQSVYSVCGSKRSRDESSSNEESSSSESEDDEAPRPIRYNPSRLRKRLVVSMDRVSGSDEPESAQYSEQETDGLGT